MSLPSGLPDLPFDTDQKTFDAWYGACLAAIDDTSFFFVDVNDGVMNFMCLHTIAGAHPDKLERIREICPEVVNAAMGELGMAMGADNIAKLLDLDARDVRDTMFAPLKQ